MNQTSVIITGAFSGLGKEFVRAFLQDPYNQILAIDKQFSSSSPWSTGEDFDDIRASQAAYRGDVGDHDFRVTMSSMDVTDESEQAQISLLPNPKIVIHSAGVRGLVPSVPIENGSDVAGAETMDVMNSQTMQQTFNVNAIGTFLLLRALIPSLRRNNGKVIIMGSRMGSIGHNSVGGGYAYRVSKAALNAVVKSFSVDVPEVLFAIVHPGRVESNLVGEGVVEKGAITAQESVNDMLQLIIGLGKNDSGKFMDRFGDEIVW